MKASAPKAAIETIVAIIDEWKPNAPVNAVPTDDHGAQFIALAIWDRPAHYIKVSYDISEFASPGWGAFISFIARITTTAGGVLLPARPTGVVIGPISITAVSKAVIPYIGVLEKWQYLRGPGADPEPQSKRINTVQWIVS